MLRTVLFGSRHIVLTLQRRFSRAGLASGDLDFISLQQSRALHFVHARFEPYCAALRFTASFTVLIEAPRKGRAISTGKSKLVRCVNCRLALLRLSLAGIRSQMSPLQFSGLKVLCCLARPT